MKSKITKEKLNSYRNTTAKAIEIAKNKIVKGKRKEAREIIEMVENYLSDSEYFEKEKDLVSAFAAINYCHGWLDAGVRLGIFNVKDSRLFTVR